MALAGLLLVRTEHHQARIGALRDGIGQQQRVGACDLRQAHFVDRAGERGEGIGGRGARRSGCGRCIGANRGGGVQRGQLGRQRHGRTAAHIQRHAVAFGLHRKVRPLAGLHRLARRAALAVHLHEGHALVDADHELAGAVAACIDRLARAERIGLDPGGEGQRAAGRHGQRGRGGQHQRAVAELGALADDRAFDGHRRGLAVVAVGGGVARRHRAFGEVVDQRVVGVEAALAVARGRGLGVAVVHPELLRRAGRDVGHVDPDQRHAQQRIELLDLVVEHGLVVARHKAQVGAGLAHAFELEVARVQAHQHRHAAGIAADGAGLRAAVDGDGFAVGPLGLPPGMGQARQERAQQRERDEKKSSHDRVLRKARGMRKKSKRGMAVAVGRSFGQ
ncbi:hypothetical protein FQZ97_794160 [compost metagenome]